MSCCCIKRAASTTVVSGLTVATLSVIMSLIFSSINPFTLACPLPANYTWVQGPRSNIASRDLASSSAITAAIAPTIFRISSSSGPSAITESEAPFRKPGQNPASLTQLLLKAGDHLIDPLVSHPRFFLVYGHILENLGNLRIFNSDTGRPAWRRAFINCKEVRMPSPVLLCSRKIIWPDCSPPKTRPLSSIADKTLRSPFSVTTTAPPASRKASINPDYYRPWPQSSYGVNVRSPKS